MSVDSWQASIADLRVRFTNDDRDAIRAYLDGPSTNSYWDRSGVLLALEEQLAAYFGRRWCLLTNSGTSALFSAYVACGIGRGDEVIASVYTYHATVTPLLVLGATPRLVDIEPGIATMDPARVEAAITAKTKAIMVTHQWGHPVDPAIIDIAREHNVALLEDVSLAVGSTGRGRLAGTYGDVAALSLGSTKLLSGGQAGALLTDDDTLWERATLLGHFGGRAAQTVISTELRPYAATGWGMNFRVHPLAVPVIAARLAKLQELTSMRAERFARLSSALASTKVFNPPPTREWATRGSWQGYFATYSGGRSVMEVAKRLQSEGLEVHPFGQPLLHHYALFQEGVNPFDRLDRGHGTWPAYAWGHFPVAEEQWAQTLAFPLFLDESLDVIDRYGEACIRVAREG